MNQEQEIRAKALEIAIQIKGPYTGGSKYAVHHYSELAKQIANYIRGNEEPLDIGNCERLPMPDGITKP